MTGTRFEFIKDDRDITMQHPLGWIAAYQEEMKLMDRQGSINKESEGLVQVCRFLVEVHQCSPEEQHLSLENSIEEVDGVPVAAAIPGEKQEQLVKEAEIFEKWKVFCKRD
ncbi:uncharacterized protein LOC143032007 isoform X2 [Oratosquilla oratoria]|uniref:uncharacterized protein LOC143032007 isoform X2 n=1 Tax=Oratosquilla oratoria TaxID=337810 RepID=UPI003F75C71D